VNLQYVPTICPYCGCGCGMYLVLKDGRIVGELSLIHISEPTRPY